MKAWKRLSPHDRRALSLAGLALLAFLFYSFIFEPLEGQRARLESRLNAAGATHQWLLDAAQEVEALSKGSTAQARPGGERSLLATVDQTARQARLSAALKRVEPQANGDVRVWLENAVVDDVFGWLSGLAGQGIEVSQLSLTAEEAPGIGTLRLTVTRPGDEP